MSHDQWLDELRKVRDATLHACRAGPAPELDAVINALVEELARRGWDGDAELADALLAATRRQPSTLRPLAVELDELGEALNEANGTANFLDLHNGQVWLHAMIEIGVADDLDVDFEDETRWLFVGGGGFRRGLPRPPALHLECHRHRSRRAAA